MLPRPAAVAAGLLLALTGCGTVDLHPGSAAVVGDERVTLEEADEFADEYCDLFRPALQQSGARVSMAEVRAVALHLQVREILARDYAEEFGIEPGPDFRRAVESLEDEAAQRQIPEDGLETYVDFRTAEEYVRAIIVEIGREELGAGTSPQQAYDNGLQEFSEWTEQQDVELDPRFGTLDEQFFYTPADSSLSSAVSDLAVLGETPPDPQAQQPDTAYADSLPASQVCG
jgi:hypothetical protein